MRPAHVNALKAGAVAARLSPAGGAGEYCCVPPPLRSRAGRYSEWLLLDVKADGR